jgi:tripartite-type tricarboxylate transporter receptor subunit TctC
VIEAGVAGYEYVGWYGLLAPAGTPAPIIERLNAEVNAILKEPAISVLSERPY